MKRILGLDLGTSSIGWALIQQNFQDKEGEILGLGSRIIPMGEAQLSSSGKGIVVSQTAKRTGYRGKRRVYQRKKLRRERLHRVLNILGFLPKHYADDIDFQENLGKFRLGTEPKINYFKNENGKHEFLFVESFNEMIEDFKLNKPKLFQQQKDGVAPSIPYDWTIYFLRQKALVKPISKEELAWIILNFNQKRGYYQLRTKNVDENSESAEKDGKTKYKYEAVNLEKDSKAIWAANKRKNEQYIEERGKFVGQIVYEKLLDQANQKIRGELIRTIERKYYKAELKAILEKQIELQPELFSNAKYRDCIEALYPNNENHRKSLEGKDFIHLFLEDIIFYQRPLKTQKHNIAGCQYEFRKYKKENEKTGEKETIKEYIPVISRSHPLFQEFRLWQWLHNLIIYEKKQRVRAQIKMDVDVTSRFISNSSDMTDLFDFLSTQEEIKQENVMNFFVEKGVIGEEEKKNFRWNYDEKRKYPCFETRSLFAKRLEDVSGMTDPVKFLREKTQVGQHGIRREEQLWHIVYSVSSQIEFESALGKFAAKHNVDVKSFVKAFKTHPSYDSDYASYSKKALRKIVPLMRVGKYWNEEDITPGTFDRYGEIQKRVTSVHPTDELKKDELAKRIEDVSDDNVPKQIVKSFLNPNEIPLSGLNTYQACYLIYGRYSEIGNVQNWETPEHIDDYLNKFKQHSLRNPNVEKVILETLRVVRDIWKYYGKSEKNYFDEIHIELSRDIKNSSRQREKKAAHNLKNEKRNARIRALLRELLSDPKIDAEIREYSPSQQEILKIYEEGVHENPKVEFEKMSKADVEKIREKHNPSLEDIARYRLWLEQGYISPYTGKIIPLSELFTKKYEVDHIIPRSLLAYDSLPNKIICETAVNRDKSNRMAAEYLKSKRKGEIIEGHSLLSYEEYQKHVNEYFKKNKTKLKNLLSEEIPESFINRQLNDSRYISKFVKNLLSNVVRKKEERETTAKNLIPSVGLITSTLKQDWGLNAIWNKLILPRFKRLNELFQTSDFTAKSAKGHPLPIVPEELLKEYLEKFSKSKGNTDQVFSKKRIDHRHHALDALVVACTTRDHIHYLNYSLSAEIENYTLRNKLLERDNQGHLRFQLPWASFPKDAMDKLSEITASFKQDQRVINKSSNTFWSYKDKDGNLHIDENGKPIKKRRKQEKGENWSIRKPLHTESFYGVYKVGTPKGKIATSVRKPLAEIKSQKHIDKITDQRIREIILPNHLKNYLDEDGKPKFKVAFSSEGIKDLNENIVELNEGKHHHPIKKVKLYETGEKKFPVGESGNKSKQYVETEKGTNLFFAIYWDEKKQKRNFETVPFYEVVAHQKRVAHLPKSQRTPIQPNPELGELLFILSPDDLVYLPSSQEQNINFDLGFQNGSSEVRNRIYKMVKATKKRCYFIPVNIAKLIVPYSAKREEESAKRKKEKKESRFNKSGEFTSQNVSERDISNSVMIKDFCIKIHVDRLGNISKA